MLHGLSLPISLTLILFSICRFIDIHNILRLQFYLIFGSVGVLLCYYNVLCIIRLLASKFSFEKVS